MATNFFNIFTLFLFATLIFVFSSTSTANAADNSMFFNRDVKWSNLPPSGGSLVSGRGNFRPGFYGNSGAAYMNEPLFAFKRSSSFLPQWLEK